MPIYTEDRETISLFEEQLKKLVDREVILCTKVLLNPHTYELMRIIMATPSHTRKAQIDALKKRNNQMNQPSFLNASANILNNSEETTDKPPKTCARCGSGNILIELPSEKLSCGACKAFLGYPEKEGL